MAHGLITHEKKAYRPYQNGVWNGWAPVPTVEATPVMHYRGPKIPFKVWQEVTAWFQAHKTDEVQVRLFRHTKTGEWRAVPFPQKYPNGMTTSEIEGHADREAIMKTLVGFVEFGSVHHHCGIAAFQSSTDNTDEAKRQGIHITVGKLGSKEHDLHGRVSVKVVGELDKAGNLLFEATQSFYEPYWVQWFEVPEEANALPPAIKEQVLLWYLKQPVGPEVSYPAEWDARLIKVEFPKYPYQPGLPGKYAPPSKGWGYEGPSKNWDESGEEAGHASHFPAYAGSKQQRADEEEEDHRIDARYARFDVLDMTGQKDGPTAVHLLKAYTEWLHDVKPAAVGKDEESLIELTAIRDMYQLPDHIMTEMLSELAKDEASLLVQGA